MRKKKDAKYFVAEQLAGTPWLESGAQVSFFPESAPPSDAPGASQLRDLYGFVPRVFRLQTPIGDILEQQIGLLEALLNREDHLSRAQKERVLLAVSATNQSSYGVALHEQTLKLLGVSESDIANLITGGLPEGPDGNLIAFARRLILQPLEHGEADVEGLRRSGFTEPQIVEVIVLIGVCDFMNTMQAGTGATPDFAARPIPPPVQDILHPEPPQVRPMVEEVQKGADDADDEWVVRVQKGDLNAFETLVERHTKRVYRTLIGLLGNPDEAKVKLLAHKEQ